MTKTRNSEFGKTTAPRCLEMPDVLQTWIHPGPAKYLTDGTTDPYGSKIDETKKKLDI